MESKLIITSYDQDVPNSYFQMGQDLCVRIQKRKHRTDVDLFFEESTDEISDLVWKMTEDLYIKRSELFTPCLSDSEEILYGGANHAVIKRPQVEVTNRGWAGFAMGVFGCGIGIGAGFGILSIFALSGYGLEVTLPSLSIPIAVGTAWGVRNGFKRRYKECDKRILSSNLMNANGKETAESIASQLNKLNGRLQIMQMERGRHSNLEKKHDILKLLPLDHSDSRY